MIANLAAKTYGVYVVISLLLVLLNSCQAKEESMDLNKLTTFAMRYATAWSNQYPTAFSLFYADNGSLAVNDGEPSVGRNEVEKKAREFMTAFPDMLVRLVEIRLENDHVVFHWHWTGTNTGPGGTGNSVDLHGYEEWTINSDGLIQQSLGHYDDAEYQRQLNASK